MTPPPSPPPSPAPSSPLIPQRAVVVDDSPSSVALMLQLLETIDGCEALGFTSSAEGLAWCRDNDVDLVIVDYEMPAPDGIAFIDAFRRDRENAVIPVVMVTSTEDLDIRYMALQIGATDFLNKPIDRIEFVARARNLLAACRAHKALAEASVWLTDEVRKTSMVVRQSPVSVVITDRDGIIEYVNPKFTETTGYQPEDVIGRTPAILKSGITSPDEYQALWQTITAGREWRGVFQNRRKDGSLLWESALIMPLRAASGEITHFVGIKEDITLRKEYEARLAWQANYDSLTGLPNRMLLLDRLSQAIPLARRGGARMAVLLVDLDRFRAINDAMGHETGDEILRQAARRLLVEQQPADTIARVGNDEFVVALSGLGESRSAEAVAARICRGMEAPFVIDGDEIFISASIGIAMFPDNGDTPQELLRNATAAMPAVNGGERGGWRFFTPELDATARRRLSLEAHLRRALARDELAVHYHPLVEVASGRILAAEALLRWHNPELGAVAPDHFIPVAEETDLIIPIGAWVIETVCRDMAAWTALGVPPPRVAVNVSSSQLRDRSLSDVIARALADNRLAAGLLELEVTERLLLDRSAHTIALLHDLRQMGLRFSIDDFGTGYSSMSYLTSFPFDVLKIDRSFISKVTERDQDRALTQAIIAMARSLDLEVVAEGVETAGQLRFLRDCGCHFAQGYLFTMPVPAAGFVETLKAGRFGVPWDGE